MKATGRKQHSHYIFFFRHKSGLWWFIAWLAMSLNATSHSHLIDLEKFWIALVVRHLFSSFASGAPGRRGEGWWYQALTCIFSRLVCLSLPAASCLQLTADQICPLFDPLVSHLVVSACWEMKQPM